MEEAEGDIEEEEARVLGAGAAGAAGTDLPWDDLVAAAGVAALVCHKSGQEVVETQTGPSRVQEEAEEEVGADSPALAEGAGAMRETGRHVQIFLTDDPPPDPNVLVGVGAMEETLPVFCRIDRVEEAVAFQGDREVMDVRIDPTDPEEAETVPIFQAETSSPHAPGRVVVGNNGGLEITPVQRDLDRAAEANNGNQAEIAIRGGLAAAIIAHGPPDPDKVVAANNGNRGISGPIIPTVRHARIALINGKTSTTIRSTTGTNGSRPTLIRSTTSKSTGRISGRP